MSEELIRFVYTAFLALNLPSLCDTDDFYFLAPFFFFLRFYLFNFREGEGREKERERSINAWLLLMLPLPGAWPTTQVCALTWNRTWPTIWFAGQHSTH